LLENRLVYQDGVYTVDFEDLERKLADPQTTLMILCNPHNPVGKVWSREELERIGILCARHHVIVLSDEIHCDLTFPGVSYTPFASVSSVCAQNTITCIAPTKTFNIAGLQAASVMVADEFLRHKVNRGLNTDEVAEPNAFAIEAAIAGFRHGGAWLDELREYIKQNVDTAVLYVEQNLPQLKIVRSQATYLLWIDCRKVDHNSDRLCESIRRDTGLYLSAGGHYGENGQGFLRMNVAVPRVRLLDGLERLKTGIEKYHSG
jgi:cystathionine beta-lyase